jgi:hypothetical protein
MSSARSMMPTQLRPKSVAFMCPLAEISRLSGLTSLQHPCLNSHTMICHRRKREHIIFCRQQNVILSLSRHDCTLSSIHKSSHSPVYDTLHEQHRRSSAAGQWVNWEVDQQPVAEPQQSGSQHHGKQPHLLMAPLQSLQARLKLHQHTHQLLA